MIFVIVLIVVNGIGEEAMRFAEYGKFYGYPV